MHHTGMQIRTAFQSDSDPNEKEYAIDYFIYLWCGPDSPLFDKSKMATFERYFITDKETHKEEKGYYFLLRDNEQVIDHIMDEFGVTGPNRHIINGHVPVRTTKGENPIKANGKLMVIDGGFSKAYHNETGIAGYTLVYHSRGFQLVQHEPFTSMEDAIKQGTDIKSTTQIVEMSNRRMLVADTDIGCELRKQIEDLKELLYAYRTWFHQGIRKEEVRNRAYYKKAPGAACIEGFFSEFSEPQSQGFTLQLHLTSGHYLLGKMLIQMIDATATQRIIHFC